MEAVVAPVVAAVVRASPATVVGARTAGTAAAAPAGAGGGVLLCGVCLLLSLVVLLALHPAVLEPDLDLALGEVEVPGQLPPLLLGDVGVEEELLLQLERLELGVGLPLLPHAHVARPVVQRVPQPRRREEEACKGDGYDVSNCKLLLLKQLDIDFTFSHVLIL